MRTKAGCRPVCFRQREYGLVLAVLLIVLSGCVTQKGSTSPLTPTIEQSARPVLLADANPKALPSEAPVHDASSEEPLDPFSKPGEEGIEEYDPWEPLNTKFFEFNRQLDRWILKPVAKGYNFLVPNIVQVGVSNIFYNSRATPRFLNNMFPGKIQRSWD